MVRTIPDNAPIVHFWFHLFQRYGMSGEQKFFLEQSKKNALELINSGNKTDKQNCYKHSCNHWAKPVFAFVYICVKRIGKSRSEREKSYSYLRDSWKELVNLTYHLSEIGIFISGAMSIYQVHDEIEVAIDEDLCIFKLIVSCLLHWK